MAARDGASKNGSSNYDADRTSKVAADRAQALLTPQANRSDGQHEILAGIPCLNAGKTKKANGNGRHASPPVPALELDEVDAEALLAEGPVQNLEFLPLLGKDRYFVVGWSHLLAGYPRAGKTELLAACVPSWLWCGQRVLFITEEPRPIWRQRLQQRQGPWKGLQLLFGFGAKPTELLERVMTGPEEVVVIDTLRNLGILGADECDNSAIARAVAPWVAACRRKEKTLVAAHHMRKGAGDHGEGIAGGHALFGAFDVALELRQDNQPNRRMVRSYARLIESVELLYEQKAEGGFRVLGDPAAVTLAGIRERVRQALGADWTPTAAIRERLDEPKPGVETLRHALYAEAENGAIERDPPLSAGRAPGRTYRWRAKS
jgi:predicted ATP-dependent serine protease